MKPLDLPLFHYYDFLCNYYTFAPNNWRTICFVSLMHCFSTSKIWRVGTLLFSATVEFLSLYSRMSGLASHFRLSLSSRTLIFGVTDSYFSIWGAPCHDRPCHSSPFSCFHFHLPCLSIKSATSYRCDSSRIRTEVNSTLIDSG